MARFGSKRSKRFRASTRVFYSGGSPRISLMTPGIKRFRRKPRNRGQLSGFVRERG